MLNLDTLIVPHRRPIYYKNNKGINDIRNILNHLLKCPIKNFHILPSGNSAIYLSLYLLSKLKYKTLLIPDMGFWTGFINYGKMLNFDIVKFKTEDGYINTETIEKEINKIVEEKNEKPILGITTLGGYLVRNPVKEIKEICDKYGVIFIEDISGGIGGNCGYGDIILCSTGSPKVVNCEYGGFLVIYDELFNKIKFDDYNIIKNDFNYLLKSYKVPESIYSHMYSEISICQKTYKKLVEYSDILKNTVECSKYVDKEGIGVFLDCNPLTIKHLNKKIVLNNGKSLFTKCPIYERVLKKGLVIEVKKIHIYDMEKDDFLLMGELINKFTQTLL